MKTVSAVVWFALSTAACFGAALPRSSPEAQGVSSRAVLSFVDAADKIDSMNSFMLLRHGHVVAEGWWAPYDAESPHSLYSLSKSFTSTAVGLAVAEGKLSLDDEVLKFFPGEAPAEPSANLKAMRVRDLLRMSTGQQTEPPRTDAQPWVKSFLAHPVPFKPGTHFLYNTSGTYMLSAIVQKATGQTVLDYLKPRLFEPLGIEKPTWETSPQGISAGGYGLSIRTEDIAKFGQLYLQKGKWQGKQVVPEGWVEEATARQTSNGSNPKSDWDQGYGYQFWRCRHGAYRGDGAFGQYCIVLPEQDAVIAITSGVKDMQAVLNLVWDKLLPALQPAPLSPDGEAAEKLHQRLKGLSLHPQEGSVAAAKVWGRKYEFPPNDRKLESVAMERDATDGTVTLVMRIGGAEQRVACGHGAWRKGKAAWGRLTTQPVAASGAWTEDGTFTARLCFYDTPFILTARLKFSGDEVRCDVQPNVGSGGPKQAELVGKARPLAALKYLWAKAYHVPPETTTEESGYFSLCEGKNGRIYIGCAAYGRDSYLVEFDPASETMRVVLDTHKLVGLPLEPTGYAAQSKIHTRNFVGPSGTIYVGSKQGYPTAKEKETGRVATYRGGYVMTYDPATGKAVNLGMPMPLGDRRLPADAKEGEGVIDVAADEARGLIYVITCEHQHWMLFDTRHPKAGYRDLGPILRDQPNTLIDRQGRATAITKDYRVARYDPAGDRVTVDELLVGGKPFRDVVGPQAVHPDWRLAADGRTAYLQLLNDLRLFQVDLGGAAGKPVAARSLGNRIEGKHPDSRGSISVGPDGRVYSSVRIDNETGFGTGYLHHLVRFDPHTDQIADLGVVAVRNPEFFDFRGPQARNPDGSLRPRHGFHTLPDGTLTPLYVIMATIVAHDGTVYATTIYPFTLLRIPAVP